MSANAISLHAAALSGAVPAIPQQPTADGLSLPRPGYRMVPAVIGWPGRQSTIFIECPSWCTEDHVVNWAHAIEDVDHYSGHEGWGTDSVLNPGEDVYELFARVHLDPVAENPALRSAHVILGNGAPEDSYLTPEMAERAADELIAFAAGLRNMARVARQANAVAGRKPRRRTQAVQLRKFEGGVA